eukprot:3208519-Amphidinium_carterae.1
MQEDSRVHSQQNRLNGNGSVVACTNGLQDLGDEPYILFTPMWRDFLGTMQPAGKMTGKSLQNIWMSRLKGKSGIPINPKGGVRLKLVD